MTIPHQPEAKCDGDPSRLPSDAGRAHPRPWLRVHEDAGPPSRPDTGDVSVSGLAGIIMMLNRSHRDHTTVSMRARQISRLGGRFGVA